MQLKKSPFILLPLALALTGCMASVGSSIAGRSVTGKSAPFSYAIFAPNDNGATITLGDKSVHVSPTQLTWNNGGLLQLPSKWNHLDLLESSNSIEVRVDGAKLKTIHPTPIPGSNRIMISSTVPNPQQKS